MRTRQLERRKKLIAWTCSSVGWISTVVYWMDALHTNSLPGQLVGGYPVDLAGLLLLMVAVVGVVAALPDDREDVNERHLWAMVLWCLGPCVLLSWLFFSPIGWFQ